MENFLTRGNTVLISSDDGVDYLLCLGTLKLGSLRYIYNFLLHYLKNSYYPDFFEPYPKLAF